MSATLLTTIGALGQGFGTSAISLGSITFVGVEVPSEISRAGAQQLVIRRLPGGTRIINSLGPDPGSRSFFGMFTGTAALARSLEMEAMRDAGAQVTLQYLGYSETVVIKGYTPKLAQRGAVIQFNVELEVLPAQAVAAAATDTPSTSVGAYAISALGSVADAITAAALYVADETSSTPTTGEVTTVAAVASGALAALSTDLTSATALSAGSTALTSSPATLASYVADLQDAGTDAMTTISESSASLVGISQIAANGIGSDAASLQAAAAHSGLVASATQAGGYINASLAGVAQMQGTAQAIPVVHS